MITLKRGAVLAAPAAVPASMALVFRWLSHRLSPTGGVQHGLGDGRVMAPNRMTM